MRYLYRGRHRANRHSLRVADLQQQCGRGAVLGPYSIAEYFALSDEMWAKR